MYVISSAPTGRQGFPNAEDFRVPPSPSPLPGGEGIAAVAATGTPVAPLGLRYSYICNPGAGAPGYYLAAPSGLCNDCASGGQSSNHFLLCFRFFFPLCLPAFVVIALASSVCALVVTALIFFALSSRNIA